MRRIRFFKTSLSSILLTFNYAQTSLSNCATRHTRHRACKQSPRSTDTVGIFRTFLSTLATRILQYWLSWVKLVCPRYLCASSMGLLGEHQTSYLVCQSVVLISMIYRALTSSVEDCLGRCGSCLSEVTIVRLHFETRMV